MAHHVETFVTDFDREYGWQCLTCGAEQTCGPAASAAAEEGARRHRAETQVNVVEQIRKGAGVHNSAEAYDAFYGTTEAP